MILFALKLFLAHILGDFVFQTDKWVKHKEKHKLKSQYLYFHLLVHTIVLIILLQDVKYWMGVTIIISSHFILDIAKIYLKGKISDRRLFLWDQLAHLIMIAIVVNIYKPFIIDFETFFTLQTISLIAAILTVTFVVSTIIKVITSKWSDDIKKEEGLKDAGLYIGMLERLLVFIFIITKHWEAIGFLLAAKSVFRFGDLSKTQDRKLTEYILIGTLISFSLAILIGMYYLQLTNSN